MAGLKPGPLALVEDLLRPDALFDRATVQQAPAWKGAYLLILRLDGPIRYDRQASDHIFEPGWYGYAGSAYGPGGIGARLRRHFRRDKKPHWHIDDLTGLASGMAAAAIRNGSECAMVARLTGSAGFRSSLDGFGSSDCRTCSSHLLEWKA